MTAIAADNEKEPCLKIGWTQRRDAITKVLGDIVRVKGEFNRYAAVSPNVSPMMAHFHAENTKLTAKIKEQAAQLDLIVGVAAACEIKMYDWMGATAIKNSCLAGRPHI